MKYFKTLGKVLFEPLFFFEQLPKKIKYKEPFLFALKTVTLGAAITTLFSVLFLLVTQIMYTKGSPLILLGMMLGVFVAIIVFSMVGLYIKTLFIQMFSSLFGANAHFLESYKIVFYSSAPSLFLVTGFISQIYSYILVGFGLYKRYKLSTAKSVGIVLCTYFLILMLIIFVYFILYLLLIAIIVSIFMGGPQ